MVGGYHPAGLRHPRFRMLSPKLMASFIDWSSGRAIDPHTTSLISQMNTNPLGRKSST
jgi:hypothetical protein